MSDPPALRASREHWIERFRTVRDRTEALAAPLSAEDQQLQSQPACSPTKWHRAHTTWFFETFVLAPRGVPPVDPQWGYLFNSYYEAIGPRHARPDRGLLSRPSCEQITSYRRDVDGRVIEQLAAADPAHLAELASILELGLAHEEQHQELLLTDALHALAQHPFAPAYHARPARDLSTTAPALTYTASDGGLVTIGAPADGFAFDNERPRHQVWLEPFALADRATTWAEVRAFADDGGYDTAALWLAEGWDLVQAHGWQAPGHVRIEDGVWRTFGLDGLGVAEPDAPAAFLSFYEADAIARWLGGRLPTEAEWEVAAVHAGGVDDGATGALVCDPRTSDLTPCRAPRHALAQMFGDVWEWTRSSFDPYPGFVPAAGALGEYNGKFMVSQQVLRGGSCFTPVGHLRPSYRNFWHPGTRFQVTGLRVARSP